MREKDLPIRFRGYMRLRETAFYAAGALIAGFIIDAGVPFWMVALIVVLPVAVMAVLLLVARAMFDEDEK